VTVIDVIRDKRDGHVLSDEAIGFLVRGASDGSIPDYQLSAWLMAVRLNGMSDGETKTLTLAMAASGRQLDLSSIPGRKVDKQLTGGVGHQATLVVAPLVAAVIYNRIKDHMPLQIDATLCYVKGGCPPVPTNADKRLNSPYNTYKVAGLPPTPIASVTAAALQAALQPANVPYLYYVISDSTGKLAFATTLRDQDHNIALAHRKGLL